jgi:SAM-dependent methyltransferase
VTAPRPSPWDCFQPWDVESFGDVILDRSEQERWSRAIFLGGLSYMWRRAEVVRGMIYERLDLRAGDRVLLLGEALAPSGFVDELRDMVGSDGHVEVIEILEEARQSYWAGRRGRGGQLATWNYDYTRELPNESFDCVAVLQGVQHADDWRAAGGELLRVMRRGRRIVLAEIAFGPQFAMRVEADLHIEYVMTKLFDRIGWHYTEFPYHGPHDLLRAFDGLVESTGTFEWKGIELFWGTKP